jgi:hypothetical protein
MTSSTKSEFDSKNFYTNNNFNQYQFYQPVVEQTFGDKLYNSGETMLIQVLTNVAAQVLTQVLTPIAMYGAVKAVQGTAYVASIAYDNTTIAAKYCYDAACDYFYPQADVPMIGTDSTQAAEAISM